MPGGGRWVVGARSSLFALGGVSCRVLFVRSCCPLLFPGRRSFRPVVAGLSLRGRVLARLVLLPWLLGGRGGWVSLPPFWFVVGRGWWLWPRPWLPFRSVCSGSPLPLRGCPVVALRRVSVCAGEVALAPGPVSVPGPPFFWRVKSVRSGFDPKSACWLSVGSCLFG